MAEQQHYTTEESVGRLLSERGWTLATAESCTGGLIGHRITQVPGSSAYFLGGVVSYADEVKRELLAVRAETLKAHGAVSRPTALEMARGVRQLLAAEVGLAVTGIAGPGGGSPEKPVGLTWIALITPRTERAQRFVFEGDRRGNKADAARTALALLAEQLEDE